ncbi:MAG: type III PLP-dependent enzyme [Lentisphaeraceae bacterium]|nr:type III PLP-dependent enzyme [Lentisphaeraceae bacterium]
MYNFDLAQEIIGQHGSPCFVLSLDEIERNFLSLSSALPNVKFYYAVKANPDKNILQKLGSLGCYFDVSTNREVEKVLEQGIPCGHCIHTHPIKHDAEIEFALEKGLKYFTVDNMYELEKFVAYKDRVKLSVRISVDNSDCRINLSEKFGCSVEEALLIIQSAKKLGLTVSCLSFHVGSQCTNPEKYIEALKSCREVEQKAREYGTCITTIDIGGGFPVAYTEDPIDIKSFCSVIANYIKEEFSDMEIIAEPGRFIVASAMTLFTTVKGKSNRNSKLWYFVDDSIYQSFSGIVFDHCDFPMYCRNEGALRPSQIAGSSCDSYDVIKKDIELPELEIGEILMFKQMGAYCSASSSHFNGYSPTQIVIEENFK